MIAVVFDPVPYLTTESSVLHVASLVDAWNNKKRQQEIRKKTSTRRKLYRHTINKWLYLSWFQDLPLLAGRQEAQISDEEETRSANSQLQIMVEKRVPERGKTKRKWAGALTNRNQRKTTQGPGWPKKLERNKETESSTQALTTSTCRDPLPASVVHEVSVVSTAGVVGVGYMRESSSPLETPVWEMWEILSWLLPGARNVEVARRLVFWQETDQHVQSSHITAMPGIPICLSYPPKREITQGLVITQPTMTCKLYRL